MDGWDGWEDMGEAPVVARRASKRSHHTPGRHPRGEVSWHASHASSPNAGQADAWLEVSRLWRAPTWVGLLRRCWPSSEGLPAVLHTRGAEAMEASRLV